MDLEPQLTTPYESLIPRVNKGRGVLGFGYEAQVQVIKQKHGDLEAIRLRLGLSKRKIAQILLVDPSAWTRWTRGGVDAPPHIYRALEWYLLIQDKYPGMDSPFWLEAVSRPITLKADSTAVRSSVAELSQQVRKLRLSLVILAVFLVFLGVFSIFR